MYIGAGALREGGNKRPGFGHLSRKSFSQTNQHEVCSQSYEQGSSYFSQCQCRCQCQCQCHWWTRRNRPMKEATSKLETTSHSFNNMSKSLFLCRVKVSHWSVQDGHELRYCVAQWHLWLRRQCTVDVSISFDIRRLFHYHFIKTFLCTATWYLHVYVLHNAHISSCSYIT